MMIKAQLHPKAPKIEVYISYEVYKIKLKRAKPSTNQKNADENPEEIGERAIINLSQKKASESLILQEKKVLERNSFKEAAIEE